MEKNTFVEKTETYRQYFDNFIKYYADSYAVQGQNRGRGWKTKHKYLSDQLIRGHLTRAYAVAVPAPFTPVYFTLDFDFGPNERGGLESNRLAETIEKLNLSPEQYFLSTSPRFAENGNLHLAIRLEKNGNPVPVRKGFKFLQSMVGNLCEIYPQPGKKFRLPFGFGQYWIEDGLVLRNLSWHEALHFALKKESVSLENMPGYGEEKYTSNSTLRRAKTRHPMDDECLLLLNDGLSCYGTRFNCQWLIVCYFQRQGCSTSEVFDKTLKWIQNGHNGYSSAINNNNWKTVYNDLTRQVKSAFKQRASHKPRCGVNSKKEAFGFTRKDLEWICNVFPGRHVEQKKLARLLAYCRANSRHYYRWIFIPHDAWAKIAGALAYKKFIFELEDLGIIQADWSYRHVPGCTEQSFPRKFRVIFPRAASAPIISGRGGEPADNYLDALISEYAADTQKISEITGVCQNRFKDYLKIHLLGGN